MPAPKTPAAEMLQCAEHGTHPSASFPSSRMVTVELLETWLERSRRIYVSWNIDTGVRRERLASTGLDPDKVRAYAALLWRRYCSEPPMRLAALEEQGELAREKINPTLRIALNHLRDAFRAPYASVPDEIQAGTQLAVALFGCAQENAETDAARGSSAARAV
jgi:hypothetical protein